MLRACFLCHCRGSRFAWRARAFYIQCFVELWDSRDNPQKTYVGYVTRSITLGVLRYFRLPRISHFWPFEVRLRWWCHIGWGARSASTSIAPPRGFGADPQERPAPRELYPIGSETCRPWGPQRGTRKLWPAWQGLWSICSWPRMGRIKSHAPPPHENCDDLRYCNSKNHRILTSQKKSISPLIGRVSNSSNLNFYPSDCDGKNFPV